MKVTFEKLKKAHTNFSRRYCCLKGMRAPEFIVNTPRKDVARNREAVLQIEKNGLTNYSIFTRTIEKIKV